jgi:predicted ATPase
VDYGSVRLLRDRAAAVRPDFELDEASAVAVARVRRSLDRMPLAIELAAVWLRTLACRRVTGDTHGTWSRVIWPGTMDTCAGQSRQPSMVPVFDSCVRRADHRLDRHPERSR